VTGLQIKCVLAAIGGAASLLLLWWRPRIPGPLALWVALALVGRLVVVCVGHLVFDLPYPSDVHGYVYHGRLSLDGLVPNRDFFTHYGLLFSYLNAAALTVRDHYLSVMALYQALEMLGIYLLCRYAFEPGEEQAAKRLLWLYLLNPIVLVSLAIASGNEVLIILALGVAVMLVRRDKPIVTGVAAAVLAWVSKPFIAWLHWSWLVQTQRRGVAVVAGLVVSAAVVVPFALLGSQIWLPTFTFPSRDQPIGEFYWSGNVWFILNQWLPRDVPRAVSTSACLAALAGSAWLVWHSRRGPKVLGLAAGTELLTLAYKVGNHMTFVHYVVPAVPCALLLGVRRADTSRVALVMVIAWSTLISVDSSLYARLRDREVMPALYVAYQFAVVAANVGVFVWLIRVCLRRAAEHRTALRGRSEAPATR